MTHNKEIGFREKVLAFFRKKEGFIKSVRPESYLDYMPNLLFVTAFIIPVLFLGFDLFSYNYLDLCAITCLIIITLWFLIRRFFLFEDQEELTLMNSGDYLDLSIVEKSLLYSRILSFLGFIALIGAAVFLITDDNYVFEWFHIVFGLIVLKFSLFLGITAYAKEHTESKIFKIDNSRLRISFGLGEKNILLDDIQKIKIAFTHLSFFPKEGKIEMLNDLELNEEEKEQLKSFLETNLTDIEVSLYKNREELFEDAAMR